jgi:hypothetical protein
MWAALSDERTGLSFARVTVGSNKSVISMYIQHIQGLCQSRLLTADHSIRIKCYDFEGPVNSSGRFSL